MFPSRPPQPRSPGLAAAGLAALTLALLPLAGAGPAGAQPAQPPPTPSPQDTAAPTQQVKVTGALLLVLAENAIARGLFDEAAEALQYAEAFPDTDPLQLQFLQAFLARERGDFAEAVILFRDILRTRPDLVRPRLELAYTLFLQEEDTQATYHFEQVLVGDVPDAVRANITRFLQTIRGRRNWFVDFTAALLPDTNINTATSADSFFIPNFIPGDPDARLTNNTRVRSGVGLHVSPTAGYRLPLSDRWRIDADLSGVARLYENKDFQDIAGTFNLRGVWLPGDGTFSVGYTLSRRWLAARSYYIGHGFEMRRFYSAPPILGRLTQKVEWLFHDRGSDKRFNSIISTTQAGARYIINPQSALNMDVGVQIRDARDNQFTSLSPLMSLSYEREWPFGINTVIGGSGFIARYKDPDFFFRIRRRDYSFSAWLSLTKRDLVYYGFAPTISYNYRRNVSNNPRHDFNRHQAFIGITRRF